MSCFLLVSYPLPQAGQLKMPVSGSSFGGTGFSLVQAEIVTTATATAIA